jgi:hypothetical protein
MAGGSSSIAPAGGNFGRNASAMKSSVSNTLPTQTKYLVRGIPHSTRPIELRHPLAADATRSGRVGHDAGQQSSQTRISRSLPWRTYMLQAGQEF